jgi:hypothetical protein
VRADGSRGLTVLGSAVLVAGVVAVATPVVSAAPMTAADTVSVTSAASTASSDNEVRVTATAGYVDTTAPPQPVPAQGDLPVAHSAVGEQARAVVALDLPADATAATVTFRASGQPGSSYGTSSVSVCRVSAPWTPGAGQPLSSAPAVDCSGSAPVKGPGPWTFDLAHILRAWSSGAPVLGIALVDNVSAAPAEITFNIVGAERVGVMTPAPAVTVPQPAPQPAPAPAPAPDPVAQPVSGGQAGYPGLGSQIVPAAPAPTVSVVPPAVVAGGPRTQPAAVVANLPALPVDPAVWLLLPLGVGFFLLLRRAVSAAADELPAVVTA